MSINLGSLINKSINPVITKAVSDVKTSIGSQLPSNQVGQICKPESPGADNKTWICDGATWHQVINSENNS